MQKLFEEYDDVIAFTDGSTSAGNPGTGGAGVAFYGRTRSNAKRNKNIPMSESDTESEVDSDADVDVEQDNKFTFLFGAQIHLGICSNNYAEYMGLIMAQLTFALLRRQKVSI